MRKQKCILIGFELFITIIGSICLILSKPFYEKLITYIQNENGSFEELLINSVGIIFSLILGLMFIWTIIAFCLKSEKGYLGREDKNMLVGWFFKVNLAPILMLIFSIVLWDSCMILSTI